jgi:hypothetical protein
VTARNAWAGGGAEIGSVSAPQHSTLSSPAAGAHDVPVLPEGKGRRRSPAAISVFTVLGSDRRVVACAMAPSDIITLLEAGARLKIQPRGPREMTKIIEAAVKGGGHVEFKQAGSPKQMLEYVKLGKGHITIIEAGDVDAQVG